MDSRLRAQVEIPLPPTEDANGVRPASVMIRLARDLVVEGRYDEAVRACRKALETARVLAGDLSGCRAARAADAADWETRIGNAVLACAIPGDPSNPGEPPAACSRDDALLMLAVCAALVSSTQRWMP